MNPGTIDDLPLFGVIFSDRYSIDLASFEEVSRHALRLLDGKTLYYNNYTDA